MHTDIGLHIYADSYIHLHTHPNRRANERDRSSKWKRCEYISDDDNDDVQSKWNSANNAVRRLTRLILLILSIYPHPDQWHYYWNKSLRQRDDFPSPLTFNQLNEINFNFFFANWIASNLNKLFQKGSKSLNFLRRKILNIHKVILVGCHKHLSWFLVLMFIKAIWFLFSFRYVSLPSSSLKPPISNRTPKNNFYFFWFSFLSFLVRFFVFFFLHFFPIVCIRTREKIK